MLASLEYHPNPRLVQEDSRPVSYQSSSLMHFERIPVVGDRCNRSSLLAIGDLELCLR